jgi:predicted NACHT family NTPase
MTSDLETIKTIATIASPLTSAIIDTWLKPKLKDLQKFIRTDRALFEHSLATRFNEYLQRSYEKHSFINVIVFQNQQRKIEDVYVPLTLKKARSRQRILMDGFKKDLVPVHKKALLRDTAGMGKTTLLKFLFLCCVNTNEGIPILIELRKLKSGQSILSYIYRELTPIEGEFDKDFVLELIKEGNFIFLLDGYDEIPFRDKEEVTSNLRDFIWRAGKNQFILTSRPEPSLASFPDFQEFNIEPLELGQAFTLLGKFDNQGALSSEVISKLNGGTLENIKEFLKNPLLVSLLYKSYDYKPIIPFKKHIFYRQVYDALFESHDLSKGGSFIREKYSDLDVDDFHRALRALGFISVKLGQIEFNKDEILELLSQAKNCSPGLTFKETDFLKDLLTTVPLFSRDGDSYKWAHKSIQEYFAGQFIWLDTKDQRHEILSKMTTSKNYSRYLNVIDLYYDMDLRTFRRAIIYDLVKSFINFSETSYSQYDFLHVLEEEVERRKSLTFGRLFICLSNRDIKPIEKGDTEPIDNILWREAESKERYQFDRYWSEGVVRCTGYKDALMNLLLSKGCDIFRNFALDKSASHEVFEQAFTREAPYEVDDSPGKLCNHPDKFTRFNRLIETDSGPCLNISKCRKLYVEIQREIENDISDDFIGDL